MTRKIWIQDRETGELIPLTDDVHRTPMSAMIMPDIQPFVSPVDKSIVHSRSDLREHNLKHNVTNVADFKETWAQAAKRREEYRQGTGSDPNLRRHLITEYERRS